MFATHYERAPLRGGGATLGADGNPVLQGAQVTIMAASVGRLMSVAAGASTPLASFLPQNPTERRLTPGEVDLFIKEIRCSVPQCDGVVCLSLSAKEALWDNFYTAAPARLRHCVERYNVVKKA